MTKETPPSEILDCLLLDKNIQIVKFVREFSYSSTSSLQNFDILHVDAIVRFHNID